jgi:hypothetical protein
MFIFNLVYVLALFFCVNSEVLPCPKVLAVNISNGTRTNNNSIINNGILYGKNNYFVRNNITYGCICNLKTCVRKCCGPDEIIVNRTCARRNFKMTFPVHEETVPVPINFVPNYSFIHSMHCDKGKMLLKPHKDYRDQFYVQANGSLFLSYEKKIRHPEEYCIEVFDNKRFDMTKMVSVLLCITDDDLVVNGSSKFYSIGKFKINN